jgi:hypothetical protein
MGHTRHEPARCMGAPQKGHAVPPICMVQAGAGVSNTVSVIQCPLVVALRCGRRAGPRRPPRLLDRT